MVERGGGLRQPSPALIVAEQSREIHLSRGLQPQDELDVLLRHRLLLKPHGFEGFLRGQEEANRGEEAAANGNYPATRRVDLDVADPSPSPPLADHEHLIIEVAYLLDLHTEVAPHLAHVGDELVNAIGAAVVHGLAHDAYEVHGESRIA